MSDFRIDQITNQAGTAGPQIAGITTFSGSSGLLMPSGPTEYRGGRGRGVIGGGFVAAADNTIDYITISTLGNTLDFGDLNTSSLSNSSFAGSTRGFFAGGYNPTYLNAITFVTISSTGSSFNFGNLVTARTSLGSCSNSIRGISAGGRTSPSNYLKDIQFTTISTLGDATYFGDLTNFRGAFASCSSSTRGIFGGGLYGSQTSPSAQNVIEYITIATTGNGQDFGDLTDANGQRQNVSGCSNSIRGLFGGGQPGLNVIDYISIASFGDAIDFGDLTVARSFGICATSSPTRGLFIGGFASPANNNTIDYITIMSTGNALDFGDLTTNRRLMSACSDAHGGLGD